MACPATQRDAIEVLTSKSHTCKYCVPGGGCPHAFTPIAVTGRRFTVSLPTIDEDLTLYFYGISTPRSIDGRAVAVFSLNPPTSGQKPPRTARHFNAAVLCTPMGDTIEIELLALDCITDTLAHFVPTGNVDNYIPTIAEASLDMRA